MTTPINVAETTQEIEVVWRHGGDGPVVRSAPPRSLAQRGIVAHLDHDPNDLGVVLLPGEPPIRYRVGAPHPSHADTVYLHRVP